LIICQMSSMCNCRQWMDMSSFPQMPIDYWKTTLFTQPKVKVLSWYLIKSTYTICFYSFFLFKSLEFKRPWLNNQPGPSLHWGKCLLAKEPKLNMQRPLWSKVKIKKKRMDPFEDTTGNNVCTLSQHHHQNWA
jgi:hypothetical protein